MESAAGIRGRPPRPHLHGPRRLPPGGRARPVGADGLAGGGPAAGIPLDSPAAADADRPDRGLAPRSAAAVPAPLAAFSTIQRGLGGVSAPSVRQTPG